MNNTPSIRIGISNSYLPGNRKTFPPEYQLKSRLHYYSTLFNTTEVNTCFYKTPQLATYEKWAREVPDDFQFTLKLSRDITHVKDLKGDLSCMDLFLKNAAGSGNKKGCILIQFPGKITIEHFTQVETILKNIYRYDTTHEWRLAVEFRHDSWYIGETTELLNQYHGTIVLHDFAKGKISESTTTANFAYLRFHGPSGNYRDSYSEHVLDEKANQIRELISKGRDVYAYFNNTIGNAFENALYLKSRL